MFMPLDSFCHLTMVAEGHQELIEHPVPDQELPRGDTHQLDKDTSLSGPVSKRHSFCQLPQPCARANGAQTGSQPLGHMHFGEKPSHLGAVALA